MTDLTAQQALGMQKLQDWYDDSAKWSGSQAETWGGMVAPVFRWFGYAGTGKTYTAARIPEALGLRRVAFGTYTGKAASVLHRSLARYGVSYPATTIHSAIYMPTTSAEARAALDEAREELASLLQLQAAMREDVERGELEMAGAMLVAAGWADMLEFNGALSEVSESIPKLEANAKRLAFEFNPSGPWANLDLIILDEVSMVNAKLAADIESYGVPVLVLGDPAQLPPVEGGGYYTDATPDHLLTDVQRQALDNPVLALATRVRESTTGKLGLEADDMRPVSLAEAMEHDQVLCWTNKRRWAMTTAMRRRKGFPENEPVAGDKIMCLTNNKDLGVFNGEQFEVLGVSRDGGDYLIQARTETGLTREIRTASDGFEGQELQVQAKNSGTGQRGRTMLATFAWAITVHKAQGSEWDSVYVVNETPAMLAMTGKREGSRAAIEQARAWVYTAATRAKEQLTITAPR